MKHQLTRKKITVHGKHGLVQRTYWVRTKSAAKRAGAAAGRHKGKIFVGAALLGTAAYATHKYGPANAAKWVARHHDQRETWAKAHVAAKASSIKTDARTHAQWAIRLSQAIGLPVNHARVRDSTQNLMRNLMQIHADAGRRDYDQKHRTQQVLRPLAERLAKHGSPATGPQRVRF